MNQTIRTTPALYLLLATLLTGSLFAQDINLPAPQKTGGLPLMDALAKRSTSRAFDSKDLSAEQLSSLLWAAFGINRADGKRTAPSANNKQATDIYVLLKRGAYVYDAKAEQTRPAPGRRHPEAWRNTGFRDQRAGHARVCR